MFCNNFFIKNSPGKGLLPYNVFVAAEMERISYFEGYTSGIFLSILSKLYTPIIAERTEYSTVNTQSPGISTN